MYAGVDPNSVAIFCTIDYDERKIDLGSGRKFTRQQFATDFSPHWAVVSPIVIGIFIDLLLF